LSPSYTGAVVPSKFFGALAAGRPVLFEGSVDCSIARWIKEHRIGWVLPTNAKIENGKSQIENELTEAEKKAIEEVGMDLLVFAADPARKE